MKEKLYELIQKQQETPVCHGRPDPRRPEMTGGVSRSCDAEDCLEQHGFQVEAGPEKLALHCSGPPGARGWRSPHWPLSIRRRPAGWGHGCGHHMQGPCICPQPLR